jgi:hypothetical protein
MADHGMDALGELICRLNPYTELPPDPTSGLSTGQMEVQTIPAGGTVATALAAQAGNAAETTFIQTVAGIAIQVASNYGEKWIFKGQPYTVKGAVLIPYRYSVYKNTRLAYWQTENLLIGYAGSDGP